MVTNINLSSPELSEKKSLSGKTALIVSLLLLALVVIVYASIIFLKGHFESQAKAADVAITQERNKIKEPGVAAMIDFQERLNLLDKAVDGHSYWDALLLKMGNYIIPEVRLNKFSGKIDSAGAGLVDISGTAASLDALSRELILLKSFPNLDSFEFKDASDSSSNVQNGAQQGGISFDASLKINKAAFQR